MLKKYICISLLIAASSFGASASDSNYISYLTSWGISDSDALYDSNTDTIFLSFGAWDSNGNITTSDDIADIPNYDPYWLSPAYIAWTQWKLENPNKKVMIAFGGQTYESIWSHIQTQEQRDNLTKNLVDMRNNSYPVYKKNLPEDEIVGECLSENWDGTCNTANYQLAGYVKLDGFDFDFEKAARITQEESNNLLSLAENIRNESTLKTILSLTTYHVGADPTECSNNTVYENCSYTEDERSSHHGEVTELLTKSSNIFDIFNVMAYDAGKNFRYDIAMNNYANAVGDKSKILLGITNNQQWGPKPAGSFVQSHEANLDRAEWQAKNGYGGMFLWALGSNTEQLSMAKQVSDFNEMIAISEQNKGGETEGGDIDDRTDLMNIEFQDGQNQLDVTEYLSQAKELNIKTYNGRWVQEIYLPDYATAGDKVNVNVQSSYRVNVNYSRSSISDNLSKGMTNIYIFRNNTWIPMTLSVSNNAVLNSLSDQDKLADLIKSTQNNDITLRLGDGHWVNAITLPANVPSGSKVTVVRNSTYGHTINLGNDTSISVPARTKVSLQYFDGSWVTESVKLTIDQMLGELKSNNLESRLQHAKANNLTLMITP